ncbi:MAG: hypothetical protein EB127_13970 [Alphaproteobacteria bacterium]|nr:hypothetical protein [Alphaproteobacteria bacterium]
MSAPQLQSKRQGKLATTRVGSVGPVGTVKGTDLDEMFGDTVKSTAVGIVEVTPHGETRVISVNAGLQGNHKYRKTKQVEERHGQLVQGQQALSQQQQALSQQFQQGIQELQTQAKNNLQYLSENLARLGDTTQKNILQLNNNLLTVQANIFAKMNEMASASDARQKELKTEIQKQQLQLEGITRELGVIKGDIAGVKDSIEHLAAAARTIQEKIDAQASSAASAAAAAAAFAGAAGAADDEPTIEIYSCTCCGGNIDRNSCSANIGGNTRVRILISRNKFRSIQAEYGDLLENAGEFGSRDARDGSYRISVRNMTHNGYGYDYTDAINDQFTRIINTR